MVSDPPKSPPLITDVATARTTVRLLFPETDRINKAIEQRRAFWITQLALDRDDLSEDQVESRRILLSTADAGLLFHANMASRYGSCADDFDWGAYDDLNPRLAAEDCPPLPAPMKLMYLPYHQEEHLIWMAERLLEVYREFDFPLQRCCVLSSSVGPHDLVQLQPGSGEDGIGWSEWLSAEEASVLMLAGGFDAELDSNLVDRVKLNIYGTTFSFDPSVGYLGALAPKLVPRIQQKYRDPDDPRADEEIQDLLLTTDVDTSALTDFREYSETAALLCQEVFLARQGLDTLPAVPTFQFLTKTQRRFWELQKFHSRYALELLQPRKEQTAPLFEDLVGTMEARFQNPEQDVLVDARGKRVTDGDVILQAFLTRAGEIADATQ